MFIFSGVDAARKPQQTSDRLSHLTEPKDGVRKDQSLGTRPCHRHPPPQRTLGLALRERDEPCEQARLVKPPQWTPLLHTRLTPRLTPRLVSPPQQEIRRGNKEHSRRAREARRNGMRLPLLRGPPRLLGPPHLFRTDAQSASGQLANTRAAAATAATR